MRQTDQDREREELVRRHLAIRSGREVRKLDDTDHMDALLFDAATNRLTAVAEIKVRVIKRTTYPDLFVAVRKIIAMERWMRIAKVGGLFVVCTWDDKQVGVLDVERLLDRRHELPVLVTGRSDRPDAPNDIEPVFMVPEWMFKWRAINTPA